MSLIKKVDPNWFPSENKSLQVGEIIDLTNAERLVDEGKAVYVDQSGAELSRGVITRCPVCVFTTADPFELADHIYQSHKRDTSKKTITLPEIKKSIEEKKEVHQEAIEKKKVKDMSPEEKKEFYAENLRKAREAAKAKKEAALMSDALKTVVAANVQN